MFEPFDQPKVSTKDAKLPSPGVAALVYRTVQMGELSVCFVQPGAACLIGVALLPPLPTKYSPSESSTPFSPTRATEKALHLLWKHTPDLVKQFCLQTEPITNCFEKKLTRKKYSPDIFPMEDTFSRLLLGNSLTTSIPGSSSG